MKKSLIILMLCTSLIGFAQKSPLQGSWISDSTIANSYIGKEMVGFNVIDYQNVTISYRLEFAPDYRIFFMINRATGNVEDSSIDKITYIGKKYAIGENIYDYKILPSGQLWCQFVTHDGNKTEVLECFYSRVK